MIQQVEGLEAELNLQAFGDRSRLHRAEVKADVFGSAQDTAARIAENFLGCGKQNRRRIPPVQKLLGTSVGIPADVAIVLLESDKVNCIIAGIETGNGQTCTCNADASNLPSAKQSLRRSRPARAPAPTLAEGELVESAVDEINFGIEDRRPVIEPEIINVRSGLTIAAIAGGGSRVQRPGPSKGA